MLSTVQIKVRGYHLDLFQHVNNARYLEFLEEGRWDFFEQMSESTEWMENYVWPVVNININFKAEARFGDVLDVQTRYAQLSQRSITMKQSIINQQTGKLVADADVTYVCFCKQAKSAIALPDNLRQSIQSAIESQA
ncbi:acyl-CoA thioesterase [Marinomonas sp. A79]|uniref:Acyl-CoA thioesterase n=1 Tax=Marinomonas vulgaris TaxID=2823372 RepID=A0ABS5HDM2_9GAMM|nr:thioesterase family protein [Marinomonas vulgaris]MBR7889590.1 acyl-CoA thioesterase [Marinomonas vulgaris]